MKKILALSLALLMLASVFAACGNQEENPTEPDPIVTDAPEVTDGSETPEVTDGADESENYSVIEKMSKHENGWVQNNWGNDSYGVYFNAKSNNAPYTEGEDYVYYRPVEESCIILVRDGESYELGNVFFDFLFKQDRTAYYLRLEEWMISDYFPIVNGDMIIVEGDFINEDNGHTIHIEKSYLTFAGDMVKFSQTDPTAE